LPKDGTLKIQEYLLLIYTARMHTHSTEYLKLSVSERIQLVEDIWDSIPDKAPETLLLSPAQSAELHRRAAAHLENPSSAIPWELVRSKLFSSEL